MRPRYFVPPSIPFLSFPFLSFPFFSFRLEKSNRRINRERADFILHLSSFISVLEKSIDSILRGKGNDRGRRYKFAGRDYLNFNISPRYSSTVKTVFSRSFGERGKNIISTDKRWRGDTPRRSCYKRDSFLFFFFTIGARSTKSEENGEKKRERERGERSDKGALLSMRQSPGSLFPAD